MHPQNRKITLKDAIARGRDPCGFCYGKAITRTGYIIEIYFSLSCVLLQLKITAMAPFSIFCRKISTGTFVPEKSEFREYTGPKGNGSISQNFRRFRIPPRPSLYVLRGFWSKSRHKQCSCWNFYKKYSFCFNLKYRNEHEK